MDDATGHRDVFWGQVPDELIKGWNRLAGEQVISHIEAYAALLVRWFFRKQWTGRKGIFFQGNDAARYSLIKAASSLASMMLIVQAFHSVDAFFFYDGMDRKDSFGFQHCRLAIQRPARESCGSHFRTFVR